MGSRFDITVAAEDSVSGNNYIDLAVEEITRIEGLISSWDPNSQTSRINNNAGISPVKVDHELLGLIQRAMAISELTNGAFDITYASMDNIWKFDGSVTTMPAAETIKASVEKVGYQSVIIDEKNQSVFLEKPGIENRLRGYWQRLCSRQGQGAINQTRSKIGNNKCFRGYEYLGQP